MNPIDALFYAAVAFVFLSLTFRPLEMAFPANPNQPWIRKGWFLDLCFFLGQYLIWNGVMLWALSSLSTILDDLLPAAFRQAVGSQPWWIQAIEVVFLSDLFVYWGHRAQHRFEWLWHFHSVHHTVEDMDWLAAHREHPVDTIYTMTLINLPPLVLGFPLETLVGLIAFRAIWAIFIHANVHLPLGPLKYLIGSPEMHHWHHNKHRNVGNYGNVTPLMDVIFGTHYVEPQEPAEFGIPQPTPRHYLGQMLYPFKALRKRSS